MGRVQVSAGPPQFPDSQQKAFMSRGCSRDRRPELPQRVLCVAVDGQGWPLAWKVFPGNTADAAALGRVVVLLRERFRIGRVVVVADRGMISKETVKLLANHGTAPFDCVLGSKLRRSKEVREEVLSRGGRCQKVADNLEVKDVRVKERRYVVCRNPREARKDALAREALVEKINATLAREGGKGLMANRGFARFLQTAQGAVRLDEAALAADVRLDGKFVLTTNTVLPAAEVALTYKNLWRVERTFREQKATLQVRPLYHQRDDTCMGHNVAGFLALPLEVDLQGRLDERGWEGSWPDLMRDLQQVQAVMVELDGRRHKDDFDRIAVVGGPKWVAWGTKLIGHFIEGQVRTFPPGGIAIGLGLAEVLTRLITFNSWPLSVAPGAQ